MVNRDCFNMGFTNFKLFIRFYNTYITFNTDTIGPFVSFSTFFWLDLECFFEM